jgi:predicted RNA binding protein YcfA (HicA-like mRNA interferase family)
MKVRDLIRELKNDGWELRSQRGSHRQYTHPSKPGRVTVPGHEGDEIAIGTLKSIYLQAQLKRK